MPKWIDEKVLQLYFKENCSHYMLRMGDEGKSIEGCSFNPEGFDNFPDLICTIDGKPTPAEVEWLSSRYDHDAKNPRRHGDFVKRGGFLVVFNKDVEICNLRQIPVNQKHFKKWFKTNAGKIFYETVKSFHEEIVFKRKYQKIWVVFVTREMVKNLEVGLKKGIWGFTEGRFNQAPQISGFQKNDLIIFFGPISNGPPYFTPRLSETRFYRLIKKNPSMAIKNISAFRVRKNYWNEKTVAQAKKRRFGVVWPDENLKNEKYPHRFKFYRYEIVNFSDVQLSRMSFTTISSLRKFMKSSPHELTHPHFMELLIQFAIPSR